MKRDPVSPELAQVILNRDRMAMVMAGLPQQKPVCIAPVVDLTQLGKCSGRSTLDHIHGQNQMGVGKSRAASDAEHLVAVCEGHSERGARAGFQWNTSHRPELRVYLAYAALGARVDD